MGQRSQIYVRMNDESGKYRLVARYFQWNFGTRMVSRARGIIEWLEGMKKFTYWISTSYKDDNVTKLERVMEINWDYKDVVLSIDILKEYEEGYYSSPIEIFTGQDNNDGQLIIDMIVDWKIKDEKGDHPVTFKYAFLNFSSEFVGNGEDYMQWNENYGEDGRAWRDNPSIKKEIKYTERNIRFLDKHAKLMTPEEVNEFINYDYVKDMGLIIKEN